MFWMRDGSIMVCVDYGALNECNVKDSFPLPRTDDLLAKLRNAKCMTHLDLRSTYNQVRISDVGPQDDSIAETTSQGLTPNGAYFYYKCWLLDLAFAMPLLHFPDL